ncbi:hypothetical protein [Heliophilum fasciatum]|uniref:hypothetical protein n=1 Tax=Heliophilum fasciatum TaxID=35700 RepID=UPI001A9ACA32|nr:hypothetical protein [Heliophilum fasciatum]MCW2277558.1 hypothetical protein [Heliophilum fasciatum]
MVEPRLAVHAVHAEKLDLSAFKKGAADFNHTKIFVLIKTAAGGWKNDYGLASVPIDFILHHLIEVMAEKVAVVLNVHGQTSILERFRS